jgi:hypothetical protein
MVHGPLRRVDSARSDSLPMTGAVAPLVGEIPSAESLSFMLHLGPSGSGLSDADGSALERRCDAGKLDSPAGPENGRGRGGFGCSD